MWNGFRTMSRIASQKGKEYDIEMNTKGEVALHGRTELFWAKAHPTMLNSSL